MPASGSQSTGEARRGEAATDQFDPLEHYLAAKAAKRDARSLPGLVRNALRVAHDASPRLLYCSLGLQLASAALLAVQVYAGKVALSEIFRADNAHGSLATALPGLVALLAATGISSFLGGLQVNVQRVLGERVVFATWRLILDVTTTVDLATFESPTFFDELQRMETNALSRPVTLLQGLIALLGGIISMTGICVALITIAPILVPILFISGAPLALLSRRGGQLEFQFQLSQTTASRMRYYLIQLQTEREHAKELRAFRTAPHLLGLWSESYRRYFSDLVKHVRRLALVSAAGSLISTGVLAFAVATLVELVLHHDLTLAAAGAGILAARALSQMISNVFSGVQEIFECTLYLHDLENFRARTDEGPSSVAEREAGEPGLRPTESLRSLTLASVGYRYPESDRPALADVSFQIDAGSVVALVGENGSGKTTLAKLIAGLLKPSAGCLRWNGADLGELDPAELGRHVTVIFQDFAKYAFSVTDNIKLGDVDRVAGDEYVVDAARRAGAHEFVSGLRSGYATMLGSVFGGIDLSVGQWQRVAIARAFYRDAEFLILDEPTSAMDPRGEAELFAKMRELAGGRTVLLISHRFSTVRSADQIIVLDRGRIDETGTHEELMQLRGRYAELFELQASGYR